MSLRRGFSIAFAVAALGVAFACICLVWFATMLDMTTRTAAEVVARHQMTEDCQRDWLLRHHARSRDIRVRLESDVRSRLEEIGAKARDEEVRNSAYEALHAVTAAIAGAPLAEDRAAAALASLEEKERQRVSETQADVKSWHRTATVFAGTTAAVVFASASLLLFVLHWRILRPLYELSACIASFRTGQTRECPVTGPDEIRDVSRAFNELTARLNEQRVSHSTFIAGVAHDLRNPIHVLLAAVDVAEMVGSQPAETAKLVAVIRRQLSSIERLVTDLLDTTNLEAGRLKLDVAEHDLREIVTNVHRLVSAGAPDLAIELDVPRSPVRITCDGPRIEQILLNVVNNALKYSEQDKRVNIAVTTTSTTATVMVRDHGPGMSKEQSERVFLPFARGARGASVPGQGLGLYLSRCIVEQHGGTIRVESALGAGSAFHIELPLRSPREVPQELEGAGAGRETIFA